jgi:hypothetical protein
MKTKSLIVHISIVIALLISALPIPAVPSVLAGETVNLLRNGDFEAGTDDWEGIEEAQIIIGSASTAISIDTETPATSPVVIETETPTAEPIAEVTVTAEPTLEPSAEITATVRPEPMPSPLPGGNVIINGGFEDGIFGWEQLTDSQVVEGDTSSGQRAVRILSNQEVRQGWLKVSPGSAYRLTAMVKWIEFGGGDWGNTRIRVHDHRWGKVAELKSLHKLIRQNEWSQVTLEFTPLTDLVLISFGVFGPQDRAELLFDDFHLSLLSAPEPPVAATHLQITKPTGSDSYETNDLSIILGGTANQAASVVWDNIDTDAAGIAANSGPITDWESGRIQLKPGRNEILVTAIDAEGKPETDRIVVNRRSAGPSISNVNLSTSHVNMYEMVEVRFQLSTVAQTYLFPYEPSPPPGQQPGTGVTVEGVFTSPSGQTLVQPAFYAVDAGRTGSSGLGHYELTTNSYWAVRFSPREKGAYQVSLRARDASGFQEVQAGSFEAGSPTKPGFVRVSKADSRYFEFENGEIFWPNGPADGPDYVSYKDTGLNMHRQWMAGLGAYSSNFARWISSAKQLGNEGFDSQLSFAERYPGHELSHELFYPEGRRFWIGWLNGAPYAPKLKPNTTYQVKARIKTIDLSGPVDDSVPHGFMVKTGGWPSETIERDLRSKQHLIPPVSVNSDWFTVVTHTTTSGSNPGPYLYLYLDNVSSGRVYIDQFSVRAVLSDGNLGGELVVNSRADLHMYVDQAAAAAIDYQVRQAEANGVYLKYVVIDKRDWILNQLTADGVFAAKGNGFYQSEGAKSAWLQKQWWRYLAARWGYSTAIHSWELNNEGSPDEPRHYEFAQRFARFMHQVDSHPHLVTTSFWCCWRPNFWGDNQNYPDIDYADLHEYVGEREAAYDVARWSIESSLAMHASNVGKPIMWGESGIGGPSKDFFKALQVPNSGDWFHDMLWSQLNPGAVSNPNYWWSEHLKQIDRRAISKAFAQFVKDLELNKGGYIDASPQIENVQIIAVGQKNLGKDKAHLWIHNRNHTWRNLMGYDGGQAPSPQSGSAMIRMNPNTTYQIQWWNTDTGTVTHTKTGVTDGAGMLPIRISDLTSDVAVKIFK